MTTMLEVLIDCLHCDGDCYKDLRNLEEVASRAEILMLDRLTDSQGRLPEELQSQYEGSLQGLTEYIENNWKTYQDFWEDIYD